MTQMIYTEICICRIIQHSLRFHGLFLQTPNEYTLRHGRGKTSFHKHLADATEVFSGLPHMRTDLLFETTENVSSSK